MIKEGMVVSLAYVLTNQDGEELDRADKSDPFDYLHGHQQVIPGLEDGIDGLAVGAKKKLVLPPADGYGYVDDRLKLTLKREGFPKDFPIEVGVQFNADLGDGRSSAFTITQMVNGNDIAVDGNHPLAGQTPHFDIEVLAVRPATEEELTHGHSHGKDGHHGHDH